MALSIITDTRFIYEYPLCYSLPSSNGGLCIPLLSKLTMSGSTLARVPLQGDVQRGTGILPRTKNIQDGTDHITHHARHWDLNLVDP